MSEIPTWWLWVSGLAFLLQSVFLVALIVVLIRVLGIVRSVQSEVRPLLGKIDDIAGTVKQLTERVDGIAKNVDGLVTSARGTVEKIGSHSSNIAGSLDAGLNRLTANGKLFEPMVKVLRVLQIAGAIKAAWLGLGLAKGKEKAKSSSPPALP